MSDLNNALADIHSIRRQMARATQFRGYGPATLAATGVAALIAAAIQTRTNPNPALHLRTYLNLWILTALLASAFAAVQIVTRTRRIHSSLSNDMIRHAIEQFLPAALAGVLVTVVLLRTSPALAWLLPGLWQLCYALGVFASCRSLPRPMLAAGAWYLLTSLICLSLGPARALAPWTMALPFAAGQFLTAAILHTYTEANELPE